MPRLGSRPGQQCDIMIIMMSRRSSDSVTSLRSVELSLDAHFKFKPGPGLSLEAEMDTAGQTPTASGPHTAGLMDHTREVKEEELTRLG